MLIFKARFKEFMELSRTPRLLLLCSDSDTLKRITGGKNQEKKDRQVEMGGWRIDDKIWD